MKATISEKDISDHLLVLAAFSALRSKVERLPPVRTNVTHESPDDNWVLYVNQAVLRFEDWAAGLDISVQEARSVDTTTLPSLDILMVWHSFLLHPHAYIAKGRQFFPGLIKLGPFPTAVVAQAIKQNAWNSVRELQTDHVQESGDVATNLPTEGSNRSTVGTSGRGVLDSQPLNLAEAVIRQGSFIRKVDGLGWTCNFPPQAVSESLSRYHAFLDLLASDHGKSLVPTLDIDLAWHTHQLQAEAYMHSTTSLLGYFLDHNDDVPSEALSASYQVTSDAWASRFGTPYFDTLKPSFKKEIGGCGSGGCTGECEGSMVRIGGCGSGGCSGECGSCGTRRSHI